jgi:hypothetical protein
MSAAQHLAQLNIGRLRYPTDDPRMADFMNNLDLVNGLAERSNGFVWRLKDDSGNATNFRPFPDPQMAVNLSVWESVEALERVANRAQAFLRPASGVVRQARWATLGDVVDSCRASADGDRGEGADRTSRGARSIRLRVRLGKRAGGAIVEDRALQRAGRTSGINR